MISYNTQRQVIELMDLLLIGVVILFFGLSFGLVTFFDFLSRSEE